jgi:hypothetical protein
VEVLVHGLSDHRLHLPLAISMVVTDDVGVTPDRLTSTRLRAQLVRCIDAGTRNGAFTPGSPGRPTVEANNRSAYHQLLMTLLLQLRTVEAEESKMLPGEEGDFLPIEHERAETLVSLADQEAADFDSMVGAARTWLAECAWGDMESDDFLSLPTSLIVRGVQTHYEGGWAGFVADAI